MIRLAFLVAFAGFTSFAWLSAAGSWESTIPSKEASSTGSSTIFTLKPDCCSVC